MVKDNSNRILIVTSSAAESENHARNLIEQGLSVQICSGIGELCEELRQGVGAVLLAHEVLEDCEIRRLEEFFDLQPTWSKVPLILLVDRLASGFYGFSSSCTLTVLERPVASVTVVNIVRGCLDFRHRQYETRDLLYILDKSRRDRDDIVALLRSDIEGPVTQCILTAESRS